MYVIRQLKVKVIGLPALHVHHPSTSKPLPNFDAPCGTVLGQRPDAAGRSPNCPGHGD
jgi:hypothetical protein